MLKYNKLITILSSVINVMILVLACLGIIPIGLFILSLLAQIVFSLYVYCGSTGIYTIRRLIQCLVVGVVLSIVSYSLLCLMPGDPIDELLKNNPKATPEDIAQIKKNHGLDKPIPVRYAKWIWGVSNGDFGNSRTYGKPVSEMLLTPLINSFILSIISFILAISIAIPLGIISALKRNTWIDYILNLKAFAGISIPSFFLGIILIIIFAVNLKLVPASGTETVNVTGFFDIITDRLKYLILPTLALTVMQTAVLLRYTRSSMLEVLKQDYMRTAKAKGLNPIYILFQHALRNALIPVVTVLALQSAHLFSGALITETLFSYNGIGKLIFDSINNSDVNMAMASFMITIVMVLLMNLIADVMYGFLDPRISYK